MVPIFAGAWALGSVIWALPGVKKLMFSVPAEMFIDGQVAKKKVVVIEKRKAMGLDPTAPLEEALVGLQRWRILDLPDPLKDLEGEYILNGDEYSQVMMWLLQADISRNLGWVGSESFNRLVEQADQNEVEAFRESFGYYQLDVAKVLEYGLRRREDPLVNGIVPQFDT